MTPAQQKLGQAIATKLEPEYANLAFSHLAKTLGCTFEDAKSRFASASDEDLERWTQLVTSGRSVPNRRKA